MKRIIAVVSVVCLVVMCLTACGPNKCKYCDEKVYKDGLCETHYYVEHPDEAITEAFKGLGDAFGSLSDELGSLKDQIGDTLSDSLGDIKGLF